MRQALLLLLVALPTVLYLLYALLRWRMAPGAAAPSGRPGIPWFWLALAGLGLGALSFVWWALSGEGGA